MSPEYVDRLTPRELDRRHLATCAFLGLDPLRSCDEPPVTSHVAERKLPGPLTEADKEYTEDVAAIVLGKEQYGFRNR